MNIDLEDTSLKNKPKQKENLFKLIYREKRILISLALLSLIVGYNNTSFLSIINTSLNVFSSNFLFEYHDLLYKLPPVLYHLGGVTGTIVCFFLHSINYKKQLIINLCLLALSYTITCMPYYILVAISRFFIGFTTSFLCAIIPQLLHSIGSENTRSILMSIYPFFNLLGLTAGASLEYFDNEQSYWKVLLAPITLCLLLVVYFLSGKNILPVVVEEKLTTKKIRNLVCKSTAIKSFISIIVMQILLRTTGIDLLMLFSSSVFSGEGKKTYFTALIPLFISVGCAPFGGLLPKFIKRKKLMFLALVSIASLCLVFYLCGPHIILASLFILLYHGVIGTIPDLYKNEIIPVEYKPMANKLGTLVSWFLGFLVTLFIAFVYNKQSNTIWLVFFILTLIGAVVVLLFMKETKDLIETGWIETWINFGFSNSRQQEDLELN